MNEAKTRATDLGGAALPGLEDVRDAAARIAPYAVVTPVLRSAALDALAGAALHFKCENLQRGGAFKFRGACNAVWSLSAAEAARGVVTHSSGNHGNALALAAATRGIAAHVVVPEGAVQAKLDAIERAGAILHRCAPTTAAREAKAAEVQAATGAVLVHPYADARVIAGQGTLALELLAQAGPLEAVVAPVGGGGLIAGVAIAGHGVQPALAVHGAEPAGADEAARSLARGERVTDFVPDTLCDGLRGTLGVPNFAALRAHGIAITTVTDAECIAAMRLLWRELKLVVEVSSATVLAAVLKARGRFAGQRVGLVLTGGNVDLDALPW
ncbi:pyridoxal-phosphate dependent enzyme [Frateuria defendens]|uniref:pyridoxal-phosphate dependent enzyme n=1 Tax=Frateuria defendens TaxID=2219559 RepID=UPI00066FE1D3|nr:pyridoxal-phosphate dependent enzyme [Frateuria defendens]